MSPRRPRNARWRCQERLEDRFCLAIAFAAEVIVTNDDFTAASAADIDGDGDLDLISVGQSVVWYENIPVGVKRTFVGPRLISASSVVSSLRADDLDGDGDIDLVAAQSQGPPIGWHENLDGHGDFGPLRTISTFSRAVNSLLTADLDRDGDVDVLSSLCDGHIVWYPNQDSKGRFGPERLIDAPTTAVDALFVADVDGDQDLDLLAAGAWYENIDGAGSFAPPIPIGATYPADMDGDGDIDVIGNARVEPSHQLDLVWYENTDSQGAFGTRHLIDRNAGDRMRMADLDGDGDLDVLSYKSALDYDDHIQFYTNQGNGVFQSDGHWLASRHYADAVLQVVDLDGDGRTDLVTLKTSLATHLTDLIWLDNRLPGDANDDGVFDTSDLDKVLSAGEYEDGEGSTGGNSSFDAGDWNGDGDFTSADLVFAFQIGRYVASRVRVDLDVDTDRDSQVEAEEDELGEQDWNSRRGAIYSVNFDRDGTRLSTDGEPLPDAIHFDDSGTPVDEDYVIENVNDEQDLATLVIRKIADSIPEGYSVFLRAREPEDLRRIHVYKKIASGTENVAIWGKATGPPSPLEIDITTWVDPASPDFQGDSLTGDTTFGIEGLFFRYVGNQVPTQLMFDGEIDLTLELREGDRLVASDSVRLKVAPWIMLSRDQPSEEVWAQAIGEQNAALLFSHHADSGYVGLDDSGQLHIVSGRIGEHWLQDHIEIGYTHRPGGPKTHIVFRLPNGSANPAWPMTELLGQDVGTFQIGADLGAGSGDRGGNLEVLPPSDAHTLGQIVMGDTSSFTLQSFLTSQEVQDPLFDISTTWLTVGHVDEITSFLAAGNVVISDPRLAWELLADTAAIPISNRYRSVFFAIGAEPEDGIVGTASSNRLYDGPATGQIRVVDEGRLKDGEYFTIQRDQFDERVFEFETGGGVARGHIAIDLTAQGRSSTGEVADIIVAAINNAAFGVKAMIDGPGIVHLWNERKGIAGNQQISETVSAPDFIAIGMTGGNSAGRDFRVGPAWQYVRTVGQVARIRGRHDGWIEIDRAWNTTSKIVPGSGATAHLYGYAESVARGGLGQAPNNGVWDPGMWWILPQAGDKYVLVEDTQFWHTGTPAIVTVEEILADPDFMELNLTLVADLIGDTRQVLEKQFPAWHFLAVPNLFFGSTDDGGEVAGRSAFSFNPGPSNLQVVSDRLFLPRQFGPRDTTGIDLFEESIREALGSSVRFVDDWQLYHALFGEVHCGTVVKHSVLSVDWWA